jgi:hypothetical protein
VDEEIALYFQQYIIIKRIISIKGNEVLICTTKWMNLENIMLIARSQKQAPAHPCLLRHYSQ